MMRWDPGGEPPVWLEPQNMPTKTPSMSGNIWMSTGYFLKRNRIWGFHHLSALSCFECPWISGFFTNLPQLPSVFVLLFSWTVKRSRIGWTTHWARPTATELTPRRFRHDGFCSHGAQDFILADFLGYAGDAKRIYPLCRFQCPS